MSSGQENFVPNVVAKARAFASNVQSLCHGPNSSSAGCWECLSLQHTQPRGMDEGHAGQKESV